MEETMRASSRIQKRMQLEAEYIQKAPKLNASNGQMHRIAKCIELNAWNSQMHRKAECTRMHLKTNERRFAKLVIRSTRRLPLSVVFLV